MKCKTHPKREAVILALNDDGIFQRGMCANCYLADEDRRRFFTSLMFDPEFRAEFERGWYGYSPRVANRCLIADECD